MLVKSEGPTSSEATITHNGLDHSEQMRVTERYGLRDGGNTLIVAPAFAQEYATP